MPEEDRAGWVDRSTRPPNNPPTHIEAFEAEEDSNPEEDQDQQRMTFKQMETKEPTMMEIPAKKGMGIAVGPGDYQPAPPKYVRADEDSTDGQDPDEDEDIKAPYLAPKQSPIPKPPG